LIRSGSAPDFRASLPPASELAIDLDRNGGGAPHRQIQTSIRERIRLGAVPAGVARPPVLAVAAELTVARGVVIEAGIACRHGPGGLLLVGPMTRRQGHRVAVMAKPVLVVVADEDTTLQALTGELESRYGAHYQVVSSSSAEMALARLAELKAAGADVPLVLADRQMPGMSGTQLLAGEAILSHGPARAFDPLGRAVDARPSLGGGGAGAAGVLPEQTDVVTGRAVPPGDHRIAGGVVARAGQTVRDGHGDRGRSLGPGPRDPRRAGPQ
jgi:hypothetical protein